MANLPPREEWDDLPEVGFGRRQEIIDGETVWVPFEEPWEIPWLDEDDPPSFWDSEGCFWRFCKTPDGRWAKRRWY